MNVIGKGKCPFDPSEVQRIHRTKAGIQRMPEQVGFVDRCLGIPEEEYLILVLFFKQQVTVQILMALQKVADWSQFTYIKPFNLLLRSRRLDGLHIKEFGVKDRFLQELRHLVLEEEDFLFFGFKLIVTQIRLDLIQCLVHQMKGRLKLNQLIFSVHSQLVQIQLQLLKCLIGEFHDSHFRLKKVVRKNQTATEVQRTYKA